MKGRSKIIEQVFRKRCGSYMHKCICNLEPILCKNLNKHTCVCKKWRKPEICRADKHLCSCTKKNRKKGIILDKCLFAH